MRRRSNSAAKGNEYMRETVIRWEEKRRKEKKREERRRKEKKREEKNKEKNGVRERRESRDRGGSIEGVCQPIYLPTERVWQAHEIAGGGARQPQVQQPLAGTGQPLLQLRLRAYVRMCEGVRVREFACVCVRLCVRAHDESVGVSKNMPLGVR